MTHVDSDKSVKEKVSLSVFDKGGNETYSGKAKISGRGNSTWSHIKKPYNLKFFEKVSLLGFEDVTKLCLLANFYDESGLKNPLGYYVAKEKGIKYTSDYRPINLFIDGDYKGLYGVVTKQEYEKHIEEDGLQAVFEFVRSTNQKNKYTTKNGTLIAFYYGDAKTSLSQIECFEDALLAKDYETAFNYIDVDSFVRKICMEEFLVNYDTTNNTSQYFYIDSAGKIVCMNAWDYDILFENPFNFYSKVERELTVYLEKGSQVFWFGSLVENDYFRNKMLETFICDYNEDFCYEISRFLKSYVLKTNCSWLCDSTLYRKERRKIIPFEFDALEKYLNLYLSIILERQDFLVSFFSNTEKYCIVNFIYTGKCTNIAVPLDVSFIDYIEDFIGLKYPDGRQVSWVSQDNKSIYDIETLTEDIIFYDTESYTKKIARINSPLRKYIHYALILIPIGLVCFLFVLLVFCELYFYYN